MTSFIGSSDAAFKVLLYDRFQQVMNFPTAGSDNTVNINHSIIQYPKEVALRVAAEKREKDLLEFISFWRTGTTLDRSRQSTSFARRGLYSAISSDSTEATLVKGVPVKMAYDVWFWSRKLDTINNALDKFFLWLHDNPRATILLNDVHELQPYITIGDVVDESPVSLKFNEGVYFVYRASVILDSWVFTTEDNYTIQSIIVTVYDKDNLNNEQMSSIIINDGSELALRLRCFRVHTNLITGEQTVES